MTGPRPGGDEQHLEGQLLRLAVARLHLDVDALGAGLGGRDLRAGQHLDAALLERALELGRHRLVFARHQPRQQLDDRDLAAVALEDRRELDADGAAAHDGNRLRHVRQVNGFVAEDDALAVDLDAGHAARRRAGGDDDFLRRRQRLLAPSCSVTSTPCSPVRRAVPLIQSILFFLKSISMPPVSPDTILSLRACTAAMSMPTPGAVDAGEAPLLGGLRHLERVRVFEQRLGGNAAPDEAGAAERLLALDHRHLQAQLRGANRRHVPAGARANHYDVVFVRQPRSLVPTPSMSLGTERSVKACRAVLSTVALAKVEALAKAGQRFLMEDSGTKSAGGRGDGRRRIDLGLELAVVELELPVHLRDLRQLPRGPPRLRERHHGHHQRRDRENPQSYVVHLRHFQLEAT